MRGAEGLQVAALTVVGAGKGKQMLSVGVPFVEGSASNLRGGQRPCVTFFCQTPYLIIGHPVALIRLWLHRL